MQGHKGSRHHAGQARQRGTKATDQCIQTIDIDAQCSDHAAIARASPHLHAQACVLYQSVEPKRNRQTNANDGKAIGGIRHPWQKSNLAAETLRQGHATRLRPPYDTHQFIKKPDAPKGREDLIEMLTVIQGMQHEALHEHPK